MELNELIEKATAHVVKMLDGTDGKRWNGDNPMYEGICGWSGVMSPMNRLAFVSKYGEAFTAMIEDEAKAVIAKREAFWDNSKAKGYEAQATEMAFASPSVLTVGMFVWGIGDGLKCDHGDLTRCIRYHLEDIEEGKEKKPQLCKIVRIEEVEDIEEVAKTFLQTWKPLEGEGGWGSDDVGEERAGSGCQYFSRLTEQEKRTYYNFCVLVRDKKGKYFMIDPEGYEYPRYVLLPREWQTIYAGIKAEVQTAMDDEKAKAAAAKAKAAAERKAAYDARCAKWEGLMQVVPEGLHTYDREYRKVGKRNVAAMAKAAFPWVRFSVSYGSGWGRGYTLKWKNGPTKDEVRNACDFGLFNFGDDTFNGMDDSTGYEEKEFVEFARKFGGVDNGVDLEREECEKDQNGDPNGKPPAPKKAFEDPGNAAEIANANREMAIADAEGRPDNGDPAKGEAYWKRNEAKRGIEIYFPSMPSEFVRNRMKLQGWRWSRVSKCWYNRFDEGTWEFARCIVMEFNKGSVAA